MAELRWNPMLEDWVMIASHRQDRPQMPKNWCPFCPGSGKVPDDYDVLKYDNDFPALMKDPPEPDDVATGLLKTAPAYGRCEVVLYSPDHHTTLPKLSTGHIKKLVDLWCERFEKLSYDKKIKYVFIFENRGEAVGVTMPHPHGQIYAYPYVPKKLQLETEASKRYHDKKARCLICDIIRDEYKDERRIIFENDSFVTILPFFSEYPYGVYIYSKKHVSDILMIDDRGRQDLADILKKTTGMLDALFDMPFPYMMCMHQSPVNTDEDFSKYYHFHIEFYPPMRSKDKIKFNASSETGAWAPCNTTSPEQMAVQLKEAYKRFENKGGE